ncbi:hypothetical protein RND71_001091 [Anisodus tanguticus]|uniref:Uncharacterized protein n=1 Tax=Anisodus tanguticus TaxID=243964 RepID=A0AAE1SYL4_9SOLA|nr:hypothetical protein RND71_001091 [Anisodus tanguticus]
MLFDVFGLCHLLAQTINDVALGVIQAGLSIYLSILIGDSVEDGSGGGSGGGLDQLISSTRSYPRREQIAPTKGKMEKTIISYALTS